MNAQSCTDAPAATASRPITEFRAFTQPRNRIHSPLSGRVSRAPRRCGCRTAGLRDQPANPAACHECSSRTPCSADPFSARYGRPLPPGLRAEAAGMSWEEFVSTYRPADGPLELLSHTVGRAGSAGKSITAIVRTGGRIRTVEAAGVGTISAMTSIVYAAGFPLEINAFHQQRAGGRVITFVECSRGYQRRWAMGRGTTTAESIVDAFISAANRVSEQR